LRSLVHSLARLPGVASQAGVEPSRTDTIVNSEAVARYGVKAEGNAERASASVLAELAGLIAAGDLELPIEATFPLDRVQDAYRRLEEGHVLGKIVSLP
jgi:NADPH:quinone reductase-like Zn-dependent oxidoreductase